MRQGSFRGLRRPAYKGADASPRSPGAPDAGANAVVHGTVPGRGKRSPFVRAEHARRGDAVQLDQQGNLDLIEARARATRNGRRSEVHGRVIAELSFGFWRYLVESRYLTALWTPALHRSFPYGPQDVLTRQRQVRSRVQQLHFVRNRAAHHEPIHQRDLRRDLDAALDLLGWVHPVAAEWAADVTSLSAVLDARPSG